jgi:hypothetical protein
MELLVQSAALVVLVAVARMVLLEGQELLGKATLAQPAHQMVRHTVLAAAAAALVQQALRLSMRAMERPAVLVERAQHRLLLDHQ